jgi:DNA transformation protein
MATTKAFLEFLVEQFAPLGAIDSKAMFGGHCLYCDGVVFALLAGNHLYLKVDNESRSIFEQQGLPAFRPFPDKDTVMSYHEAPADMFESAEALRYWAGLAIAAGRRSVTKRPATRRRRTSQTP